MICRTILDAMGNTPLIQLNRMVGANSARVLVKFEGLNIGGSIKTRTAWNMILDAEKRGIITKDTVIVEPTSGNQGIGLALVGAALELAKKLGKGKTVVTVLPDTAERYFSTPLFDSDLTF